MRVAIVLAALATAGASVPARADDPALAAKLYGALRLMTGGGAGQTVTAERTGDTVTLVARSDQVEVGEPPQKLPFTWTLHDRGDGTYAITGFAMPSPLIVTRDGMDPAKGVPRTVTVSAEIPSIAATGTLDPSGKTLQSYDLKAEHLKGEVNVAEETGGAHGPFTVASLRSAVVMGPVVNDLTDLDRRVAINGLAAEATTPKGPVSLTLGGLDIHALTHGANPAAASAAAEALNRQMEAARRADGTPDPAQFGPAMLRPLLAVLGASGHDTDSVAAMSDLAITAQGKVVALHTLGMHFGSDGTATTHAFFEISAAGLTAPVPPQYADLVPQSMVFRPAVRGVDGAKLSRLIDAASAEPQDMDAVQAAALDLTSTPGAAFVIEALQLDLKDIQIDAHGDVRRAAGGPIPAAADMEVRATGLDALIAKLSKLPDAQQILPGLIYAKGLAKQDGSAMVWAIHAEGAQVLVNGLPVFPAGRPPAPPGAAPGAPPGARKPPK